MDFTEGVCQHLSRNHVEGRDDFVLHCTFFHGMCACGIGAPRATRDG